MASFDERKLKDRAHALVRDGKLGAAIEVYLTLITQNRVDPALRLRHAELCSRLNRNDAAVASYRVAAHLLTTAGHHAKAHAALNCAMRLAPADLGIRRALKGVAAAQQPAHVPVPRPGTVEIAAVVVDLGAELDDAPTEVFIPAWA